MLIYKQKQTNDGKQWYTEALKVGDIAWLHDSWQDFDKREEEKDIKGSYWKCLFSYAEILPRNNEFRLPTEKDIAATNLWLKDKENLQLFEKFFHIINGGSGVDQFWVQGCLIPQIGSLASGQIVLDLSCSEGVEEPEHDIHICYSPQAQGHMIVPACECEEIPD